MSDYIPVSQVVENWGIQDFEFIEYIKKGLQPYSTNGQPIHCPKAFNVSNKLKNQLETLKRFIESLHSLDEIDIEFESNETIYIKSDDQRCRRYYRVAKFLVNIKTPEGIKKKVKLGEINDFSGCRILCIAGDQVQVRIDKRPFYKMMRIEHPNPGPTMPDKPRVVPELFLYSDDIEELMKQRNYLKNKISNIQNELIEISADDPNMNSWKYFEMPVTDKYINDVLLMLKQSLLKVNDVRKFEDKYNLKSLELKNMPIESLKKEKMKNVFTCSPGTEWKDVKITLISDETVRTQTPQDSGRYSYHQLGMVNTKTGKPKIVWHILKLFAAYTGRLDSSIPESVKRVLLSDFNIDYYRKLPDYTKRLNKHLKELFRIKDSIFKYHYKKYKAYITKIEFSDLRHIDKLNPN
jgi:hypothetical protein